MPYSKRASDLDPDQCLIDLLSLLTSSESPRPEGRGFLLGQSDYAFDLPPEHWASGIESLSIVELACTGGNDPGVADLMPPIVLHPVKERHGPYRTIFATGAPVLKQVLPCFGFRFDGGDGAL